MPNTKKISSLTPMFLFYKNIKAKLKQIEEGRWRDDPELANMDIRKVEKLTQEMRETIDLAKDVGFEQLIKVHSVN